MSLIQNVEAARTWFRERGPERRLPLHLVPHHDFQLLERTAQPSLPGPLPANFADWDAPLVARDAGLQAASGGVVERRSTLQFGKHLRVV
jgi:hypothetical protein